MSKAKRPRRVILTPFEKKALTAINEDGLLTLAAIQRLLQCSFSKAVEIALRLSELELVKTNIKELKIERI